LDAYSHWAAGFSGADGDDFDLHDHLKAATAARRIPIQLVREDRALAYPDRASVMWRIGLAIYAKAGGVPWKLADGLRQDARARRQTNGRTRLRPLPIPLLHVAVDAPRVSNDDAQSAAAELATRLPVVCTAAHRTRSASNHQGDLTMPMDLAGSKRLKTYSARAFALSKGDLARGRTKCSSISS
jgi:hypothetical protein